MTAKINKEKKRKPFKINELEFFPKSMENIHVVTETFTQRRSECKFYLLHTVEYSFFIVYKRNLLFSYQLSLVICSALFFILRFVF